MKRTHICISNDIQFNIVLRKTNKRKFDNFNVSLNNEKDIVLFRLLSRYDKIECYRLVVDVIQSYHPMYNQFSNTYSEFIQDGKMTMNIRLKGRG